MVKTLDRTKDIFLDTMLLGNEILTKKIKSDTGQAVILNYLKLLRILSNLLLQYLKNIY